MKRIFFLIAFLILNFQLAHGAEGWLIRDVCSTDYPSPVADRSFCTELSTLTDKYYNGASWISYPPGGGSGNALTSDPLSQFAATTSLQLKNTISDETGSGALVFANTPTLVTPVLGAATGTSLNLSGLTASRCVETDGSKNLVSAAAACAAGGGMSIGGAVTSGTAGSILFVAAGPVLGQSNTLLFWDGDQLGVGINSSLSGIIHARGTDDTNSFIKVDGGSVSADVILGVDNTPAGLGYVGTSTNHPFHLYSNNTSQAVLSTGGNLELSTGNLSVGTLISTAHLSIQKSANDTGPGVNMQIRNTSTSTNSFSIVQMQANNTTVTGHLVVDGLGSGSILGTPGAYVGTFSNHPFGIDTNNTKRLTVTAAGQVQIEALKTTGSATGKKMVCVDTSTGQLYASSVDTSCLN